MSPMKALGYVRVSTDRQALSLEAQEAKIRAMATVQGADLEDVIVDGGESARSLNRPGLQRLIGLVNGGKVEAVPALSAGGTGGRHGLPPRRTSCGREVLRAHRQEQQRDRTSSARTTKITI